MRQTQAFRNNSSTMTKSMTVQKYLNTDHHSDMLKKQKSI